MHRHPKFTVRIVLLHPNGVCDLPTLTAPGPCTQEPDGENEVWGTAASALRSPDPSAAQGFGMTEPMGTDHHIPLEQYRCAPSGPRHSC